MVKKLEIKKVKNFGKKWLVEGHATPETTADVVYRLNKRKDFSVRKNLIDAPKEFWDDIQKAEKFGRRSTREPE